MSLVYDDNGRPFIIVREQEAKSRLTGLDARKAHIAAAKSVSSIMKSSLGPRGMDKIMQSPDGDIVISNDGATILKYIRVEHQIAKLLVELSQSQDEEIGDGTTGVVVLAGALLEEAQILLEKGIHATKVSDGFEFACQRAVEHLERTAIPLSKINGSITRESMLRIARTSLSSKIVSKHQELFAEMAVEAVLSVASPNGEIDFDMIRVVGKVGGELGDSQLVHGIILEKEFSHSQMEKELIASNNPCLDGDSPTKDSDAFLKIAILNCPFELPKPKSKHKLDILNAEEFERLKEYEKRTFNAMVQGVKDTGASLVICQWGFDYEANYLLLQAGLPAIRWVGGSEMELLAIATEGRIVARFQDLDPTKLGRARSVREISLGTTRERLIFVEGCPNSKALSILLRGGNSMIVEESKRALHDAICAVRNVLRDGRIVYGGGASDIGTCLAVSKSANDVVGLEQYGVRAFANALEALPSALATNSGLNAIESVAVIKAAQASRPSECGDRWGIDCMSIGTNDMALQMVTDPLISKRQQLLLATQLVRMILKIDDVIVTGDHQ